MSRMQLDTESEVQKSSLDDKRNFRVISSVEKWKIQENIFLKKKHRE